MNWNTKPKFALNFLGKVCFRCAVSVSKTCLPSFLAVCAQEMVRRGEILDDDMEDEFYLRRLDAGLFVLQLICYIMVEINNSGISQVHLQTHRLWHPD